MIHKSSNFNYGQNTPILRIYWCLNVKGSDIMSHNVINPPQKKGVLITGCTGFLGSNLVIKLLEDDNLKLFCLARSKKVSAAKRAFAILENCCLLSNKSNIIPKIKDIQIIEGDITKPFLNIPTDTIDHLKLQNIGQIWHCAAYVRFDEAYRKVVLQNNLEGTRNVECLATLLGISDFNYISTAFVAGSKDGFIDEKEFDNQYEANNPYEESKRLAEHFLINNLNKANYNLRIFRPSIIIGNSKTFKTSSDFSYYGIVKSIKKFKEWVEDLMPDYFKENELTVFGDAEASMNMIPVDILVEEALDVSEKENSSRLVIRHLTNPYNVSLQKIIQVINSFFPDISININNNIDKLKPLDRIFEDKITFLSPYLRGNKSFKRIRQLSRFDKDLHITDDHLREYTESFLDDYDKIVKNESDKSDFSLNKLTKKSISTRIGKDLTYYTIGSGEPLLFINAIGISIHIWKWIIDELSKNYYLIIFEHRGLFESQKPENNLNFIYTINEHVIDLDEIIINEKIDIVSLVAWCSGTKIALQYCLDNPEKVNRTILIAGDYYPYLRCEEQKKTQFHLNLRNIAKVIREDQGKLDYFLSAITLYFTNQIANVEKNILQVLSAINPKYRKYILGPFMTVETIKNYFCMLNAYDSLDITQNLGSIKIPTLIISGQNDLIANPKQSEDIYRMIPNAKYIDLPEASHFLIVENKDEVCKEIHHFLRNAS